MARADPQRTIGRYELEEKIGEGSLAEVWRAKSFGVEGFEKTLVIKRLLPELGRDARFVERFVREAQLAVRLSHANVVQVFDLGRVEEPDHSSLYLAMEHVAGRDLGSVALPWLSAGTGAPLGFALFVAAEIAKALDHAHRRRDERLELLGVVHGDLGPNNVLLSWDGEVKVSDFCVMRALWAEVPDPLADPRLVPKLGSASPELLSGRPPTTASDVFALGVLLYQLLSARHPFLGATPHETRARLLSGSWSSLSELRPELPGGVIALVERALSLDPSARHGSSGELYEELVAQRYVAGARYAAEDLAELLEARRAQPATLPESVEDLLETTRSESLRPPAPKVSIPVPPSVEPEREPSVLGALSELKNERELSFLVARLGVRGDKGEVREHLRQLFTRYGGRLLEEGEREVAAVFGLGAVDSLDTEHAVRAGLVAVRAYASSEDLTVAVDLARLELDASGALVEDERAKTALAAARRIASAAVRRVVVSTAAARNLRGQFELTPAIAGSKGARLPYLVGEARPLDSTLVRFVGRKAELRRLGEALKVAGRRQLQVMGLTGPHGIGKTRLLHEAIERISRGSFNIGSHIADCLPRGREEPYSALVAMLRAMCGVREGDPAQVILAVEPRLRALGLVNVEVTAVLGALGVVRGESAGGGALGAAVSRMFQSLAEDRLHIFAWDNAHELDDESGAALSSVASRLANSRVLLLFAGRPRSDAPYQLIPGYTELGLDDLDENDVRRLVALRVGVEKVPDELFAFVLERAGGHPMFVEELVREALESGAIVVENGEVSRMALDGVLAVPRPLRALIVDRVRRLPERERDLLVASAILGAPVDLSVLGAMLDLPLGTVSTLSDSLIEKQLLIREDPVSLGFATTLLPEVLLGELDPDARAELHLAAANAYPMVLAERTEQEASRIARHFAEAGERTRASGFYATSAYFHLSARRLERAAADFTRSLELSDWRTQSPAELAEWVAALGQAVRHVRAGAKLPDLVQRLWLHLQSDTSFDPALCVRISIDLALILGALSRYKDALRLLASAVTQAEKWPELSQAALMAEGELAARQGEFKVALAALERARGLALSSAQEEHRRLLSTAQAAGAAGEHDTALEALSRAQALFPDGEEPVLALERAKVRGLIHGFRGDWARCAEESAQAADQARALGLPHEVAIHLHNQGDGLMRTGDLPRAYAILTRSLSVAERIGADRLVNLDQMMLAYLDALNGSEPAQKLLGQKLAHAEAQKWTWDALSGRTLLGKLLARRGDVIGARRELSLAKRLAEATSNKLVLDDCERALGELAQKRSGT
ncbi:MAG: protein kinase [Polyangiaceae bacterium]|nr:protein kinase [Polyangiaceae bacterium]MCL4750016.1 protein kinase [Myxococcales bacterium]